MEDRKIRVAITHGDTNGIGYEVILKALEDPMMLELCTPIIYGSPKVASYHRKAMELETQFYTINNAEDANPDKVNLLVTFDEEVKVDFGQPTDESAEAARKAMARAKEDLQKGLFDVLITGPVKANPNPPREDRALTMMASDMVRIGLVTTHLPIKDVSKAITKEAIIEKAKIFHQSLKRDFRISNPRIAVLSLNPHAGDNGLLGSEEQDVIKPAIEELEKMGIQAFGPYPADGFFGNNTYYHFDGVLAMYHDQGLAPFKTIALESGVNFTAGLPIIRTSPDHGTAYDIAGQGKADENSFRQAVYTAIDVYRNRQNYDEPLKNPLPKLFHEKRDDSEKVRFAIPKAKDAIES